MRMAEILEHKQREPQRTLVKAATRALAYEVKAAGQENLQETEELIKQGKKLIMMPNHLSNADFPVVIQSLRSNGYKEIAENTVPPWGIKLKNNVFTNFLSAAFNRIPVWPPTIQPTREQREEFLEMNRKAREEATRVLQNGGNLLIFAEGTRSRTGQLQKGDERIELFLKLVPDEFVLPVGIIGTEKLLPPGRIFPLPYPPTVVYGKPMLVDNLGKHHMIDPIMREIAKLLPQQYRGVYA